MYGVPFAFRGPSTAVLTTSVSSISPFPSACWLGVFGTHATYRTQTNSSKSAAGTPKFKQWALKFFEAWETDQARIAGTDEDSDDDSSEADETA
jgi:hypothetical protein